MSSKGIGIGGILKLTLALMTASLFISVSTVGDLAEQIEDQMKKIQNATDYTVEVNDVETLSQASKFVRQRAGNDGCKEENDGAVDNFNTVAQQNDEGGYPALSDSYLGRYPNCLGTASTLVRGTGVVDSAQSQLYEEGQDMEGIYSRVRFEVTEPIAIETSEESESPNTWLEDRIVGVSKQGFTENIMNHEECLTHGENNEPDHFAAYLGMGDHYVMYFQPEQASKEPYRADKFMQEFADRLKDRAYCHPEGELYEFQEIVIPEFDQHPVTSATRRLENKIVLCPGDRGYIQMNKHTPVSGAEVGETWAGTSANFPHIQIENLGTSTNGTCLPAEMEPAAVFEEVENIERIELPNEMDDQLAAMVPDKIENAYEGFIEDEWEDSYADRSLDWLKDQASTAAGYIASGVETVADSISDLGDKLGDLIGLDDGPDDVAEFLEEEGIDPIEDMFSTAVDAVAEALDGQMKDSLHIELSFTNQHVDMNDDAFPADFRGGFRILFWEGGDDEEVNGKFEIEPAGGLYDEDVRQGVEGAGELDALQAGWLDGNGGIGELGCYVKAELLMEQKRTSMDYPERSEQVWDIYIGDLVDAGSSSDTKSDCSGRDGRIDDERAGIAWGGLSTLGSLEVEANNYYPEEEKLEVTATASPNDEGDGSLDGGRLELGRNINYEFQMNEFANCGEDSCSSTTNFSGIASDTSPEIEARFQRNDETQTETIDPELSEFYPAEDILGPEEWSWDTVYNSTTGLYNVTVSFGDKPDEGRSTDLESGTMEVINISGSTDETVRNVDCDSSEWYTECVTDLNEIAPAAGGELELNTTISMDGAMLWDSRTLTPP